MDDRELPLLTSALEDLSRRLNQGHVTAAAADLEQVEGLFREVLSSFGDQRRVMIDVRVDPKEGRLTVSFARRDGALLASPAEVLEALKRRR